MSTNEREYMAKYREENKDQIKAQRRGYYERTHAEHIARNALYRARKMAATPESADLACILQFYESAQFLTIMTGENWCVDHKIPLSRGGKHEPNNLQVISVEENLKKGARLWN